MIVLVYLVNLSNGILLCLSQVSPNLSKGITVAKSTPTSKMLHHSQ
jgi:hypothetical protein